MKARNTATRSDKLLSLEALAVALVAALTLLAAGCSSTSSAYREQMFAGRNQLQSRSYPEARESFLKAASIAPTPMSYAFAATASYKVGDLQNASRYLGEAERLNGAMTFAALRIAGYRALVLLKSGKTGEGYAALKAYIDLYRGLNPLMTIQDLELMYRDRNVDLPVLEKLIDEQVNTYEGDIKQLLDTGTGYLGNKYEQRTLGGPK